MARCPGRVCVLSSILSGSGLLEPQAADRSRSSLARVLSGRAEARPGQAGHSPLWLGSLTSALSLQCPHSHNEGLNWESAPATSLCDSQSRSTGLPLPRPQREKLPRGGEGSGAKLRTTVEEQVTWLPAPGLPSGTFTRETSAASAERCESQTARAAPHALQRSSGATRSPSQGAEHIRTARPSSAQHLSSPFFTPPAKITDGRVRAPLNTYTSKLQLVPSLDIFHAVKIRLFASGFLMRPLVHG